MLSRQWIAWSDPDDDATAAPFDCLGFAPLLCDTHAEEDDWNELRALLEFQQRPARAAMESPAARCCACIPTDGPSRLAATSSASNVRRCINLREMRDDLNSQLPVYV